MGVFAQQRCPPNRIQGSKSSIWSACVTVMSAFGGKADINRSCSETALHLGIDGPSSPFLVDCEAGVVTTS